MPKVTFGIIALNAQPFLEYNLRSLYPFAHQIIVVEGAALAAASLATQRGHSTDGTLKMLSDFKAEEDPQDKLTIVTAEEEWGREDGFWGEKTEMSQAYARRASGDWLWQVDADEFYRREAMEVVFQLLEQDPDITAISFPYLEFWGGFDFLNTGQWHLYDHPAFHRLFRWKAEHQYVEHRPPTVVDERGRDLRSLKWITHRQMQRLGVYLYHYSYVLPKQAQQKVGYYANVTWTDAFKENERWYQESYLELKHPFFVGEKGRKVPQWLQRYRGEHPTQIRLLQQDLRDGKLNAELRPVGDIDKLLDSPLYRLGCWLFQAYTFLFWHTRQLLKPLTSSVRAGLEAVVKRTGGTR
jgi:hypothetical protein